MQIRNKRGRGAKGTLMLSMRLAMLRFVRHLPAQFHAWNHCCLQVSLQLSEAGRRPQTIPPLPLMQV